jgi:hypothetical protein
MGISSSNGSDCDSFGELSRLVMPSSNKVSNFLKLKKY